MQKRIFALLCSMIMVVAIVPAFATDATSIGNNTKLNKNHKTTTNLTDTQLAKLNLTQTKLNALIVKIDNLTATYKNNTKAKGILIALAQYKKQAKKINKQINYLKAHPPKYHGKVLNKRVNVVIKNFAFKQHILSKKVTLKAKLLSKISN